MGSLLTSGIVLLLHNQHDVGMSLVGAALMHFKGKQQ
jgi:hypothetical protein